MAFFESDSDVSKDEDDSEDDIFMEELFRGGAKAREVKVTESEFNVDFVSRVIPKLDYDTLWTAADGLGYSAELPKKLVENYESNEDFLKKVHHVLLEVEVLEGDLICPETGRKFPITSGIPNMLLNEDEVKY